MREGLRFRYEPPFKVRLMIGDFGIGQKNERRLRLRDAREELRFRCEPALDVA